MAEAAAIAVITVAMTVVRSQQEQAALASARKQAERDALLAELPEETLDLTKMQEESEAGKLLLGEDPKVQRKKGKKKYKIGLDPEIQGAAGIQLSDGSEGLTL